MPGRRPSDEGPGLGSITPDINEDHALALLKFHSLPAEDISLIALNPRLKGSYKVKLAVANHPRCPLKIALSQLKHLRIFDLASITRNQFVKSELRKKVELMIDERLSALPAGVKIALIKKSGPDLLVRVMQKSDQRVIAACLDSPLVTEEKLYKLIVGRAAKSVLIRAIASHEKWTRQYDIRMALVRNFNTPMERVVEFIQKLRLTDLELLYQDDGLPTATRPFIYREMKERAGIPLPPEELPLERYEVDEDADMEGFDDISGQ